VAPLVTDGAGMPYLLTETQLLIASLPGAGAGVVRRGVVASVHAGGAVDR